MNTVPVRNILRSHIFVSSLGTIAGFSDVAHKENGVMDKCFWTPRDWSGPATLDDVWCSNHMGWFLIERCVLPLFRTVQDATVLPSGTVFFHESVLYCIRSRQHELPPLLPKSCHNRCDWSPSLRHEGRRSDQYLHKSMCRLNHYMVHSEAARVGEGVSTWTSMECEASQDSIIRKRFWHQFSSEAIAYERTKWKSMVVFDCTHKQRNLTVSKHTTSFHYPSTSQSLWLKILWSFQNYCPVHMSHIIKIH